MDYPYENLNPETFQLFCQALLVKEHPGMQCYPVAQPDGGRDAAQLYFSETGEKSFIMFQVKFVRQAPAEKDPHKWLIKVMTDEAPKIKKQIPAGAKMYILMTNVSGTSHPESGSIDSINSILETELGLPAICLWRNDLSRRLDTAWDLKWDYPALMTGPDLIRLIVESNLSENPQRRTAAIRAFLTNQYHIEQHVKFKQVDLDNKLLDLFIDVPIGPGFGSRWQTANLRRHNFFPRGEVVWTQHYDPDMDDESAEFYSSAYTPKTRTTTPGAATVLLTRSMIKDFPFAVLEGAPGQGKSTITQYICQVHRMRLLIKSDDLKLIPTDHANSAVRLPIKVDLRDFAAWLIRRNPFTAESEELPSELWEKSLESFLAALIRNQSGGCAFDVSDLHAIVRLSAVLLVLDGLDEVADIKRRAEVVSEIIKGAERLNSVSASLQVVVTSRPAAFENSPGLPEESFRYFSLASVNQELIDEYATKWVKARRLEERESSDVKRILREKLNQPHLKDLARNPMQLAILLSLIHTRGASLPDKRTALYDSYVELFFNRESEKSNIVRDHRDLLIDIHRYLAWLLHVEAEHSDERSAGRPNGAIEESRLKTVLRSYLSSEGHDPNLADVLFTGVIERVVALVSRVQGTYEFEVQPLREYFAARFLHDTAPYSPVGGEKKGTRPDRFDAIARNFYWLNVTRFYAGCYSKGELASLIDRLGELLRDPDFRYLSHPRVLGATLLGDWVFTQHPRSVSEVLRLVLDGIGLRFLLTSNSRRQSHGQPFLLPTACGRNELVSKCIAMLRAKPPGDYAIDVLDVLRSNTSRDEVLPMWQTETCACTGKSRTAWLEYGLHLGCLPTVSLEELKDLLTDAPLSVERVNLLLSARRSDFFEPSTQVFSAAVDFLLDRTASVRHDVRNRTILESFGAALDPGLYSVAFRDPSSAPLVEVWKRHSYRGAPPLSESFEALAELPMPDSCKEVISGASIASRIDARKWATELSPWESVVSAGQRHFGERWAFFHLANVASAIKSGVETCTDCADLFDSGKSIVRRVRYARLRAGTPTWWVKELQEASTRMQKLLVSALYFTWASSNTTGETLAIADTILSELPQDQWAILFDSVKEAISLTRTRPNEKIIEIDKAMVGSLITSHRTSALLRLRSKHGTSLLLYNNWLLSDTGSDYRILSAFQSDALERLVNQGGDDEKHLHVLAAAYENGLLAPRFASPAFSRRIQVGGIPFQVAVKIVANAASYPGFLIAAAEARCRVETAKSIKPVGKVAEEEHWFKHQ